MARKKKDDAPPFEFPEFDEQEYMEKEIINSRMTLVDIGVGLLLATLGFVIMLQTGDTLSKGLAFLFVVLIGLIARYGLTDLYEKLGFDTEHLEKKHMFGHGFAMFATWVAVLTLLSNPPISDFDEPHIKSVDVYYLDQDTGNYTKTTNPNITEGATIQIRVKIVDNGKLEKESLRLVLTRNWNQNQNQVSLDPDQTMLKRLNGTDDPIYVGLDGYKLEESGEYELKIFAEDSFGNQRQRTFRFQVT